MKHYDLQNYIFFKCYTLTLLKFYSAKKLSFPDYQNNYPFLQRGIFHYSIWENVSKRFHKQ